MSRFGTVIGGAANTVSYIVQGATPEALVAAASAAGVKAFGPLTNPVVTSVDLTGAGDGDMFFLEVQGAAGVNAEGGIVASSLGTSMFMGSDAETLTKLMQGAMGSSPVVDVQIAGASQGQRVMGLVLTGTLLGAGGGGCCVTWRPDGLGDAVTFDEVMLVVAANKGPTTIYCPQIAAGVVYVIEPGPPPAVPVVYDMKGSIFKGPAAPHDIVKVQIRRGATLFNLGEITGGLRLQTNKQAAVGPTPADPEALTFPAVPGASWTFAVTRGAEIKNLANATAPMLLVPTTNEFYVAFSELGNADVESGGFPTVFAPAGATLNVVAISGGLSLDTVQQRGWIGSDVAATVNWIHDGTMAFPSPPPGPQFWDNTGAGYHPLLLGQNVNQPTGCVGGVGPSSKRPTFQGGGQPSFGCMYFDQQLGAVTTIAPFFTSGLPIWFNGDFVTGFATGWVDATGASVP